MTSVAQRYRALAIVCRMLARLVRDEYPDHYTVRAIVETWGNGYGRGLSLEEQRALALIEAEGLFVDEVEED